MQKCVFLSDLLRGMPSKDVSHSSHRAKTKEGHINRLSFQALSACHSTYVNSVHACELSADHVWLTCCSVRSLLLPPEGAATEITEMLLTGAPMAAATWLVDAWLKLLYS